MASIGDRAGSTAPTKRHREADADPSGVGGGSSKRYAAAATAAVRSAGEDDDFEDLYEYEDDSEGDEEACADGADERSQEDTARATEPRYLVLTESALRARQEADTARVAEVLSIPAGFAAILLRHFHWRVGRAQEEWFSEGSAAVRAAVGLPDGAAAEAAPSSSPRACGVCFEDQPAGATRAAACGAHFFCDDCWRGYIGAAVGDGARCLSLRCPEPSCAAAVARELADHVLPAADRARYARFWLRSYVEESAGRVRWCAGPGCPRALEYLDGDGEEQRSADVVCACRHGVCWRCGEEAHRPVACATVWAWLEKNKSGAETANWVAAHTKLCPKCKRPIEKNQGCNHMRCSAPCGHHFCWLCLQPAGGANHYSCQDPRPGVGAATSASEETAEQRSKRQAGAALRRYLHHYERWAANRASLDAALRDMAALLERGGLERMARAADRPVSDLGFVAEAYRQVADGRRVLRWAHAYGYYLDPERDAAKRGLFDDLEGQANRWLECLHGAAEVERKELFGSAGGGDGDGVAAAAFVAHREKVANLTRVTRRFLDNLVRAFETDLPEVVAGTPPPPPRKEAEAPQRMPRSGSVRWYIGRNLGSIARQG